MASFFYKPYWIRKIFKKLNIYATTEKKPRPQTKASRAHVISSRDLSSSGSLKNSTEFQNMLSEN